MRRIVPLLALLAGCDPLIGGRCSDGWTPSPGACDAGAVVDVPTDAATVDVTGDASASDAPAADVPLDAPTVDVTGDATTSDATIDADSATDATIDADSATDASADGAAPTADVPPDASVVDVVASDVACTPPEEVCGGVCVNVSTHRDHCGACGRACAAGQVCASGACAASCSPPLLLCAGECVDPQTDAENCGGCDVRCSTGICNAGRCRDARAGHLVLIGHDYQDTRPDQNRVLGNAVFLSASSAPRVAIYAVGARAGSPAHVVEAIRQVAGLRAWTERPVATAEALPAAFSVDTTDVVLIHHLAATADKSVAAIARRVAGPAVGFLRAGGVVVVLDGAGPGAGTWPVAESTGLIPANGHRVATGGAAEVVAPADAVAVGLPLAYRAEEGSVAFTGTDGMGVVIRATAGPMVIHRVVFGL